jgi:hypothetical protein
MAKIVRLTEQDLVRLVNRVINEQKTYTKADNENGIDGFFNKIRNILIKKGYNKVNPVDNRFPHIAMAKGKNRVDTLIENDHSFILLSKNGRPNSEKTKIYIDDLKDINGPYKVEYYTVTENVGFKLNKTENMNVGQVLQLIQSM